MKVTPLISATLLALSLVGAAQAAPPAPAHTDNIAPATIVLAHCEANALSTCSLDANTPAAKNSDAETELPPTDPKQQAQIDPATPVPEPQTFVMLMLGLVVLGFASRRRQASEKFSD